METFISLLKTLLCVLHLDKWFLEVHIVEHTCQIFPLLIDWNFFELAQTNFMGFYVFVGLNQLSPAHLLEFSQYINPFFL